MGNRLRIRFKCVSCERSVGGDPYIYNVKLVAESGDESENRWFLASSPTGSIEITRLVREPMDVGRSYHVEFTPAVHPLID